MLKTIDDESLVDIGALALGTTIISIIILILGLSIANSSIFIILGIIGTMIGIISLTTVVYIHHKLWSTNG
jgi:hypothetical protein